MVFIYICIFKYNNIDLYNKALRSHLYFNYSWPNDWTKLADLADVIRF